MISHEHRCIFIHIPKCAGTSIESTLGHLEGHTGRGGQDHRTIRMIERPFPTPAIFSTGENCYEALRRIRHRFRRVANYRNHFSVTKEQFDSYFKFTIVRNPWARAFSWYENVMRDEIHMKTYGLTQRIGLKDFLRMHAGKGMLRPQTYWLRSFRGSMPLDLIGRFEDLPATFRAVCESINLPEASLPHRLKGGRTDYVRAYDQASRDLAWRIYREEIDLFGYAFES